MKIVLLDRATLGDANLEPLKELGELKVYDVTTKEQTIERSKEADIVITNKVVFDRDIIEALPNLKMIAIAATGMNNVDLEYAKERGVVVKNVSGYSTNSVVQHTFMLALALIGKLNYYNSYVKGGEWASSPIFTNLEQPFFEISGKKWGIVGLGTIGKEVARVAKAFGADVVYYSTNKNPHSKEYRHIELDELLGSCDIVSIHAPLNSNTKYLISKDELALLKDGAILINVGRGGIVDEKALADEIKNERIYAGLDVVSKEPISKDSPLNSILDSDNFVLTPHVAWGSVEARKKLIEGVVENIKKL